MDRMVAPVIPVDLIEFCSAFTLGDDSGKKLALQNLSALFVGTIHDASLGDGV